MKTYFQFLKEAATSDNQQNTHITHFEDVVFYRGYEGVRSAIDLAVKITKEPNSVYISEKFDGSPAVFFGPAPKSGKFFVAKKGIFNKDPKIYFTPEEIKNDVDGDLAKKLIYALHFLRELKPTEILQGDMLFTKGDVKTGQVEEKNYLLFHPNTLVYGVEAHSPEANAVVQAKMGIVLHTKWSGNDLKKLIPTFNIGPSDYQKTTNVFVHDPSIDGKDFLGLDIAKEIVRALKAAKALSKPLNKIAINKQLSRALESHHNYLVKRSSNTIADVAYIQSLKKFLQEKNPALLREINDEEIKQIIGLHKLMEEIKYKIYKHLNKRDGPITAFIKEKTSVMYKSDIEGFVANRKGHYPLKFVDRTKFSRYNFDDDNVERGWSKND